jgi:hypothetical protein
MTVEIVIEIGVDSVYTVVSRFEEKEKKFFWWS